MKIPLISVIVLLGTLKLFGQNGSSRLPNEWDKTFVISYDYTGSMSGGASHVTFTHDSCKYVATSRQVPTKEKKFALSQADRIEILKKMHELKVDDIKVKPGITVQNDGWSDVLCFGGHCLEGGSGAKMSDKDKGMFLAACRYLEEFAITK
jgi:hypothetical protein